MLSDVLFEASSDVGRWQRDCPEWYDPFSAEIGKVRTVMDCLRMVLDYMGGDACTDGMRARLWDELRNLDTSRLDYARDAWLLACRRPAEERGVIIELTADEDFQMPPDDDIPF